MATMENAPVRMSWAVGSKNKAKVQCVADVAKQCFPETLEAQASSPGTIPHLHEHTIVPVEVVSAVAAQPMSAEESIKGAQHRALSALEFLLKQQSAEGCNQVGQPGVRYLGVGLEGGLEKIGEKWFECGWMAVVELEGGVSGSAVKRWGIGSSARFEMSQKMMKKIIDEKKELGQVMDELTGEKDVRSGLGAMGILTDGHLGRAAAYSQGLIFALAPFLSSREKYW